MKKRMQQVALAIVFGLGIPGLIFGITASAKKEMPQTTQFPQETTACLESP